MDHITLSEFECPLIKKQFAFFQTKMFRYIFSDNMTIMTTILSTALPFNYATAAVVVSIVWFPTRQFLRRMTGRSKSRSSNQRISRGGRLFVEEIEEMATATVDVHVSNNNKTWRDLFWNIFWDAFQFILAGLSGILAAVWNASNSLFTRAALPIIAKGKLRQSVRFQQHSDGSVHTRRLYYDRNAAPVEPVVEEDISTPGRQPRRTIPVTTTPLPAMPMYDTATTPTNTRIPESDPITVDITPPPQKDLLQPPKSPNPPPVAAFASVKDRVATPMKKRPRRVDDHHLDISVQPPPQSAMVPFSEPSATMMIPMIPLSIQFARKRGRTTTTTTSTEEARQPIKRMALVSRQRRAKPNPKMEDNKRKEREVNLVKEFSRKRPKFEPTTTTTTTTLNVPPKPSFAFGSTTVHTTKPSVTTTEPAFSFSTALADATNASGLQSEATTKKVPAFSFATALATETSDTDASATDATAAAQPAVAFAFGSTEVASTTSTNVAWGSDSAEASGGNSKPTFAFKSKTVEEDTAATVTHPNEAPGGKPPVVFAFGSNSGTDATLPSFSFGTTAPVAASGFSFGATAVAPGPPAFGAVPSFGGGGAASQRRRAAKSRRKGMA